MALLPAELQSSKVYSAVLDSVWSGWELAPDSASQAAAGHCFQVLPPHPRPICARARSYLRPTTRPILPMRLCTNLGTATPRLWLVYSRTLRSWQRISTH